MSRIVVSRKGPAVPGGAAIRTRGARRRPLNVAWVLALACVLAAVRPAGGQIRFDLARNESDYLFRGTERFDYTGVAFASGDLDGDGILDLAVSAFLADGPGGGRPDAGLVTVVFGAPRPEAGPDDPGLTRIWGARPEDLAGIDVAVGDLNGDGIDDLALSAPGVDGPPGDPRENAGAVYVLFGSDRRASGWPRSIDLASVPANVTIFGPDPLDTLGGPFLFEPLGFVALDGDSFSDLAIGFPGGDGPDGTRDSAGEIHVIPGAASFAPVIDLHQGSPRVVYGAEEGDLLGEALTTGDFDGDGIGDLVGGAKNADGPLDLIPKAGEAVGILGRPDLPVVLDLAVTPPVYDFLVYGIDPYDRSSRSVGAGDLNGDGRDDLIIGARHADGSTNLPEQESAGEAYVILGDPQIGGEYFLALDAALTLYGEDPNDSVGYDVAVGDLNGDGYGDLISGAQFADGEGNLRGKSGEVDVILGGATLPAVVDLLVDDPDIRVQGAEVQDSLGTSVGAADLDGDGIDDLLTGAPGRVYKQLTIPPVHADLAPIVHGGALWMLRGAPVMARLDRSPGEVPPGGSFDLTMTLSNLLLEGRAVRVLLGWVVPLPQGEEVVPLKTKDLSLGGRATVSRSRTLPVSADTPPGTYQIEIVIESPPGVAVDRDRVSLDVVQDAGR